MAVVGAHDLELELAGDLGNGRPEVRQALRSKAIAQIEPAFRNLQIDAISIQNQAPLGQFELLLRTGVISDVHEHQPC